MAWIEAHDNLPDHPKTVLSAHALKMDKDALVGKLIRFWTWALDNRRTGFIPFSDMETVAERMRWTKRPQALFDALCLSPEGEDCGFLEKTEDGYRIHNWAEYTKAYYAAEIKREHDRKRKQKATEIPAEFQRNSSGNKTEERRNSTLNRNLYRNLYRNEEDDEVGTKRASAHEEEPSDDFDDPNAGIDDEIIAFRRVMKATQDCGWKLPAPKDERDADDCIAEFGADWTVAAIERAHERGKCSWGYVKSILSRWQGNGGIDGVEGSAPPGKGGGYWVNDIQVDRERFMADMELYSKRSNCKVNRIADNKILVEVGSCGQVTRMQSGQ